MSLYLGIDTSNYTTSVALYEAKRRTIYQIKIPLTVKKGERGLRQNDAVFLHNKNLPLALKEIFQLKDKKILACGASNAPRAVEGSYMPCFLVGLGYADALSSALEVPVFQFSHQEGHIAAALYSSHKLSLFKEPFIAFQLSGGTTEALLVTKSEDENKIFETKIISKTLDISAGQVIDRIGVLLGLSFPCGMELERLANKCEYKIMPFICEKENNFNFSGLENKCVAMINAGVAKEQVALFLLLSIAKSIEAVLKKLQTEYSLPIVFAGGVMSNKIIKSCLNKYENTFFSESNFSSDNAAGIAILTALKKEGL